MSLSDFERDLLASGPADAPSAERKAANRARIMRAAGLATAAAAVTTTTASSAGAAKGLGVAKIVALIAVGVSGAGVVAGVVHSATRDEAPSASASASAAPLRAPLAAREAASAPPPPTAVPEPVPVPVPVPVVTSAPAPPASSSSSASVRPITAHAPVVSASSAIAPPTDPLALETSLLEAARTCAARGDLACATAKLADHEKRFPHGALGDEAALLRIEVAHQRGDAATARALAERFLVSHPSGSYARRARAILGELDAQ